MSNRIMPAQIKIGETVRLEISLPSAPEDETWTRVNVNMRRVRDTEVTVLAEADNALTENLAEIDIDAGTTATMADGVYRYQLTATGSGGFVCVLEFGVVDVVDPLDPQRNDTERMVDILRSVLESRMTGSGDVASYSIAGRQVNLIPLDDLKELLYDYEERLSRQRKPKQRQDVRKIRF